MFACIIRKDSNEMKNIQIFKVAGKDTFPHRFLKDGAEILTKPNSEICSLSISHGIFPYALQSYKTQTYFQKRQEGLAYFVTTINFKNH